MGGRETRRYSSSHPVILRVRTATSNSSATPLSTPEGESVLPVVRPVDADHIEARLATWTRSSRQATSFHGNHRLERVQLTSPIIN
ncbi:hypothetical protein [Halocatena marina]|uniref:hypothetical protein n=1 Tax=Halocatena marina TaxID=2934937 RepID=UPI0036F229EB